MRTFFLSIFFLSVLFCSKNSLAQYDSIMVQNEWRTFITHLPASYTSTKQYPIVVNLHGLNSNAAQQQSYSQFDAFADLKNFIVIYPNAQAGSWVINGTSDVNFISQLIDTTRSRYSTNDFLFMMGMSQGGFLSYKLICSLSQNVKAVGVVSGNISLNLQNNCSFSKGIPVLHFHGTSDSIVNYNGAFGLPPVLTTIDWLIGQNACSTTPLISNIPDMVLSDSSTVQKYYYANGRDGSEVTFYKINNGGHTWPGSSPIPPFGFTNQDIDASQIIADFFESFTAVVGTYNELKESKTFPYPNPFTNTIQISNVPHHTTYQLINPDGQLIWAGGDLTNTDFSYLTQGLYTLLISTSTGTYAKKILKK